MSTEPTSVYDIDYPDWDASTDERRAEVMAWMRAEGMDPDHIRRVEVYQTDEPYAIATEYVRDERGHAVMDPETSTPARAERTVALSSLPPKETG